MLYLFIHTQTDENILISTQTQRIMQSIKKQLPVTNHSFDLSSMGFTRYYLSREGSTK